MNYQRLSKFTSQEVAITSINSNYHNMAKCFMSIYIEGWDLHVVDQEKESGFNIDFAFEIDI